MAGTLDAQLLEILACPADDHAPLRPGTPDDPDADALTCTSCARVYEVRDGIPVLLLDEAKAPAQAEPESGTDSEDPTPKEPDERGDESAEHAGRRDEPDSDGV